MAVEGGVVQAVFPEGGLSRDGCLRKPRIGLLDYMLRTFRPDGGRDIVFVPVAVNYDRVLEDRTLLLNTDPDAERRSGRRAVTKFFAFLARNIWLGLRGRWFRFGYAGANYGAPISLRQYLAEHDWNPHGLERDTRIERVKELADDLMTAIGNVVPVLPVSLVATVFARTEYTTEVGLRMLTLRNLLVDIGGKYGAKDSELKVINYYANSIRHLLPGGE
jgi:glycerol-3-phosphate O-acyltransferase